MVQDSQADVVHRLCILTIQVILGLAFAEFAAFDKVNGSVYVQFRFQAIGPGRLSRIAEAGEFTTKTR